METTERNENISANSNKAVEKSKLREKEIIIKAVSLEIAGEKPEELVIIEL